MDIAEELQLQVNYRAFLDYFRQHPLSPKFSLGRVVSWDKGRSIHALDNAWANGVSARSLVEFSASYAEGRNFANHRRRTSNLVGLDQLMSALFKFKCSDPRGHVYGILGPVDWSTQPPIEADYAKDSLRLALEVTQHLLIDWQTEDTGRPYRLYKLLDILSLLRVGSPGISDLALIPSYGVPSPHGAAVPKETLLDHWLAVQLTNADLRKDAARRAGGSMATKNFMLLVAHAVYGLPGEQWERVNNVMTMLAEFKSDSTMSVCTTLLDEASIDRVHQHLVSSGHSAILIDVKFTCDLPTTFALALGRNLGGARYKTESADSVARAESLTHLETILNTMISRTQLVVDWWSAEPPIAQIDMRLQPAEFQDEILRLYEGRLHYEEDLAADEERSEVALL